MVTLITSDYFAPSPFVKEPNCHLEIVGQIKNMTNTEFNEQIPHFELLLQELEFTTGNILTSLSNAIDEYLSKRSSD